MSANTGTLSTGTTAVTTVDDNAATACLVPLEHQPEPVEVHEPESLEVVTVRDLLR